MAAGRPAAPTAGRPSLCPRPASARGSRPVVKASARLGVAAPNPVGSAPRAGEQGQCTLNRSPSGGPERASLFVPRAWRPSPSPVPPPSPAGTSQPREGGGLGPPRLHLVAGAYHLIGTGWWSNQRETRLSKRFRFVRRRIEPCSKREKAWNELPDQAEAQARPRAAGSRNAPSRAGPPPGRAPGRGAVACEISRARVFSSRDVPVPPMTPPRRAARVRALRDRLSLLSKYRIEDRPLLFVFVCLFVLLF